MQPTVSVSPLSSASVARRSTLTGRDRRAARAIAEAMFSEDGEVNEHRLEGLVDDVDRYVSAASKPLRLGLRIALLAISLSPIVLFAYASRLHRLPVSARVEVLARLERSTFAPLSLAFIGWRTIMTLVFYEDARELQAIGYSGEARERYKRRLPTMTAPTPPPIESGVRLKDLDALPDSEPDLATATTGGREVA